MEKIEINDLIDILTSMYNSQIALDKNAIEKLKKQGFNNAIDLSNYCFKSGWNEAIKSILQALEDEKQK